MGVPDQVLSKKELNSLLLTVSENEALVKQARGLASGMWAGLALTAAAALFYELDQFAVLPENRYTAPAMLSLMGAGITAAILMSVFSSTKYIKASQNYNLYIMGLPITE